METRYIEILKGLPASGKSTYAKEKVLKNADWVRINKDSLRAMLHDGKYSRGREKAIIAVQTSMIKEFMDSSLNIIIDDTNFSPKHENRIRQLVDKFNSGSDIQYEVIINESFLDVTYAECIARDAKRIDSVGTKVIHDMWSRYVWDPVELDYDLADCYICDLDGTMALRGDRGWFDWNRVDEDSINLPVFRTIEALRECGYCIIYLTGRDGSCYNKTESWLKSHNLLEIGDYLYSRAEGDNRKDSIVKKELYENHIKGKYNVVAVFDDRTQVVDMWRDMGIPCFQVNWGDF